MRIRVLPGNEFPSEHALRWREIQRTSPALGSPYFSVEFVQAVAAVRNDVFVSILEDGADIVGFFPFQRGRWRLGKPVGGALSDFHGMIALPDVEVDAGELLQGAGLVAWDFHHALASQSTWALHSTERDVSHFIDLTGGYNAFVATLEARGSKLVRDTAYKRRRLEREVGEVRFVDHERDTNVLDTLLDWKSRQYNSSRKVDIFSIAWIRELMHRIHETQTEHFSGMLSALYAGDQLVAAHMGMRSHTAWNWWFPRHDEQYHRLSPGITLRMLAIERAGALGLERVDLGCGGADTYKPRLSTGGIPVAIGRVERRSLPTAAQWVRRKIEASLRASPLKSVMRRPGRVIRWLERKGRFR